VIDLSFRSAFGLTAQIASRFLHGQVTNDVKKTSSRQGCYSAITTAKGKMKAT